MQIRVYQIKETPASQHCHILRLLTSGADEAYIVLVTELMTSGTLKLSFRQQAF
jgi:hypothetical protein